MTHVPSTPETRAEAKAAVSEAYATMARVQRRWPEVRRLKEIALREREENGFGPKAARMFRA